MVMRTIEKFIAHEASSGLLLIFAAVLALILNNSAIAWLYDSLLTTPMVVQIGALKLDKPLLLWINDGLMAVFFLLVGLEIKREALTGQLSSPEQVILPGVAAVGGMAAPVLIYLLVTQGQPDLAEGWAIPAATDIAFALGILALLGKRVPLALKVFLLVLAIIDDLGAILIIAIFYTADLSTPMLAGAGAALAGLVALNRFRVVSVAPYVLLGIVLWIFVLKSGVHATLAGVALALAIPMSRGSRAEGEAGSPLEDMEHALHPWVAYMIMPLFAFANAGVHLEGVGLETLIAPLPLGIAAGLFLGKQAGVFGFVWLAVKLGLARLPEGVSWTEIYGAACLAGIGFTMSLFIGTLAFADPEHASGVRIGVLSGSLLSALLGYLVLRLGTGTVAKEASMGGPARA